MVTISRIAKSLSVALVLASISTRLYSQDAKQAEHEAMYRKYLEFSSYVKGGRVEPRWMADGNSFWYVEGAPGDPIFWKVDPETDTGPTPFFDVHRLRAALVRAIGRQEPDQRLPFDSFTFADDRESAIRFQVADKSYVLNLTSYEIVPESLPISAVAAQLGINADLYVKLQQVLKKRGRSTSDLEAVLHHVNQGAGLTGLGLTAEALQAMTP